MKKIFVLIYLLVELFFLGSFSPGECGESPQTDCYRNSDCMINSIKYYGPRCVIKDLSEDRELRMFVLHKIGEGHSKWLEIANLLRPGTENARTHELVMAVGEALENKPQNVFSISTKNYEIIEICSGADINDIRYGSLDLAISATEKRIKIVKSIKEKTEDNKITEQCDECIKGLEKAKDSIKKFYSENERKD